MKGFLVAASLLAWQAVFAQAPEKTPDSLYKNFLQPPAAARPRVWWHWMNGNITRDGIRKDLEWMHKTGIGGFQNFDASLMTPQIVDQRLVFMTPGWKDAFRFTTRLADSLKLEMAIAGSPGWSETGGPWVRLQDGMKKLVWTEVRVSEGARGVRLAAPAGVTGPFQNIPKQAEFGDTGHAAVLPGIYQDVAVVAFRLPEADRSLSELGAEVSSSAGRFTLQQLTDGDLAASSLLPRDSIRGSSWIQFAFPQPQTIKAVTIVGGGNPGMFGQGAAPADGRALEVSDDGIHFQFVCYIPPGAILQQTMLIPVTTARYFRIVVKNPPVEFNGLAAMVGVPVKPFTPPGTEIAELVLHPVDRINRFEEKVAFAPVGDLNSKPTRLSNDVVQTAGIIDLTHRMQPDGSLGWTVPSGNWKIIRFGYSLLGINNHPASPEATGPEVDKLDPVAIRNYFTNYLDQYQAATGGLMGKRGLQYMITDSWEAGAQNWTGAMIAEFQKRRGYSLIPWLPVLTGQIVGSSVASEQFLFDFRKTLGEMVVEYHYDALTRILAERGMRRYSESHENGRALIADGMDVKRTAAIPMSAIWTPNPFINGNDQTYHEADIRESASVAHLWGQNLVAAESLTALGIPAAAWSYSPELLKPTADLAMANGLNRFVIHTSVHQPVDNKIPGLGLGPFGQWFTRHETWAGQARAWTDYLARSCYLLQSGHFVADVAYFYGEDNNVTSLFGRKLPDIPVGYSYDFINATALLNLVSVRNGSLVTPGGMSYRILMLDSNAAIMSLPVLRKIAALVRSGARVAGVRPRQPSGIKDANGGEFDRLVAAIWDQPGGKIKPERTVGEALAALAVEPDVSVAAPQQQIPFRYVHRRLSDREIYWVNNRSGAVRDLELSFRITGKVPELWFAENGKIEKLSYQIEGSRTKVQLHMEPWDALFIVFRKKAAQVSLQLPPVQVSALAELRGPWQVRFQEGRGAPASASLNELASWSQNADPGIRYFSGTASYDQTFRVEESWLNEGKEIWLNLGEVKELAEVFVNGRSLGVLWKHPYRVDITGAVKTGENKLEVRVTNLWVNRLIGDAQSETTQKITYTTMPFYQANSPLRPSGLLGPVQLLSVNRR